jgi:putative restriction endonuclease
MSQVWWVNHKQTVSQEIDGHYLWSPRADKNNRRLEYYDNMRRAAPGDFVVSYANGRVGHIGRVTEFAVPGHKPAEFGTKGAQWSSDGWFLPVFWVPLTPPVSPKALIGTLGPLLPTKHSPLKSYSGDGNQRYLTRVSKAVLDVIVSASTYDAELLSRGGANSLTFQAVKERLDDEAETRVRENLTLDDTTKKTVIQARRGQGTFRANVEAVEKACRLTGIANPALLIASHIKPWRSCETAQERLHGMNGLLLTPDADLLFDRGFITFEDDGEVRVSARFDRDDLRRLGLGDLVSPLKGFSEAPMTWRTAAFAADQCHYLEYHRTQVYVGELV